MSYARLFTFLLAAVSPAGTVLAGIDVFNNGTQWTAAVSQYTTTRLSFGSDSSTTPVAFQGIPHNAPLTNDFLRTLGFELFSDSGAGFSRVTTPFYGIRADDNASYFDLRFTQPIMGVWYSDEHCRGYEAWLGNTFVATLPLSQNTVQGFAASDPSYQFDRIRFLTSGTQYPQYVVGLSYYMLFATVPAPGPAIVIALAGCVSRRRRQS